MLFALCYYASYYRYSLNFRDEGGTETLLAKRLLEGERPFLEVTLGYNVLWYYPIVALFKFFGVNYILLRVYCFGLSTLTAALGFLTVARAGRRPWVAFLVALLLVLVPGMTFKNYMPLLAVANAFCLLHFALSERRVWSWLAVGSTVLGLSFLIRIDVGLFCAALWLGGVWLRAWRDRNARLALLGPLGVAALVVVVHLPVYLDAQRRGFAEPFLNQYAGWPRSLTSKIPQLFRHPAPPPNRVAMPGAAAVSPEASPASPPINHETLQRKSWHDLFGASKPENQQLAALLYWPILTSLLLIAWAVARMVLAGRHPERREDFAAGLGALLLLGAALTVFPQYFFFRPDSPHLSEFSPGFWVAVAGSGLLLGRGHRWPARLLALLILAHASLYLWRMMPDRWTGTIAARHSRTFHFRGANGVDVMVSRREAEGLKELQRLIESYSTRDDYLVAYPYHPAVNVLADRRTYEKNVYIDNATSRPDWNAQAIAQIVKYRPALVIISDWDINLTNASRFSVWAEKTKTWVQTHYNYQGTYPVGTTDSFEVYTRELNPNQPAPQ